MKPVGQPDDLQAESIEFVPKRELDRAKQEIDRLRKENDRLKQEAERLRRELETALRACKRQAAPHSRGNPKVNPKQPGRKPGILPFLANGERQLIVRHDYLSDPLL